jgi:hypothetical protein
LKRIAFAALLLLGLAMTVLVAPAYALDLSQLPILTWNFTNADVSPAVVNFLIQAFSLGSVRVSWTHLHLTGQIVITSNLATISLTTGSYVQDFSIQGVNATLSGVHNFTGIIKIHLGTNAAPPELVDFIID